MDIERVLDRIERVCTPTSIFLYDSQARSDAIAGSDYEIGVLLKEEDYIGHLVLQEAVKEASVNVYPFRLEQFRTGNPDTPFNKNIYVREVIVSGKTLRGEKIIENMKPPSIRVLDVLSDVQFNLGRALSAIIAHRNNSTPTANLLFSKSYFFSTRALVMEKTGKFPITYASIISEAKNLDLRKYTDLTEAAHQARQTGSYDPIMLFKNISYLNQFVIPTFQETFEKNGNKIVVK